MISWAKVANKIGDAICNPMYRVLDDILINKSILISSGSGTCVAYIGKISKLLNSALKSQYTPPRFIKIKIPISEIILVKIET